MESRIFQIDQKCPINGSDDYHICIVPINSYLLGNQQYLLYWKGDEWNIATRSIISNLDVKNQDISWRKIRLEYSMNHPITSHGRFNVT